MENNWKDLKRKYKFRRVLLVSVSAFLILSVGWFAGRGVIKIGYADSGSNNNEMILAQLGHSENVDDFLSEDKTDVKEVEIKKQPSPQDERWELVLISEAHPIAEDYPVELERISGGLYVDERIVVSLKQMFAQAKSDGINLEVVSAHESFETHGKKYEEKINEFKVQGMSDEKAEKEVQRFMFGSGTTDHHTGLSVDILSPDFTKEGSDDSSFEKSNAFDWLKENSADYGFILRFPKGKEEMTKSDYTPWHFRYVGQEAATEIWEKEYCLEEYLFFKDRSTTKTDTFIVELETLETSKEDKDDKDKVEKKSDEVSSNTSKPVENNTTVESYNQNEESIKQKPPVEEKKIEEDTSTVAPETPKLEIEQKQPEIEKEESEEQEQKIRVVTNKDMAPKPKVEEEEPEAKPEPKLVNDFGEKIDNPNAFPKS